MKSTPKKSSKKPVTSAQASNTGEQKKAHTDHVDTKTIDPVAGKPASVPPSPENNPAIKASAEQAKSVTEQETKAGLNQEKAPVKSAAAPATEAKSRPLPASKSTSMWLTLGAFLLAGLAVTFSILMWQQVNQLTQQLEATIGSETMQAGDTAKQQTQALTHKIDSLQRALEGLQTEFDMLNRTDKQADLIADLYSNPKTDMLPLSIRSLLTSAEMQVTLTNSVHPLLATLTSIDNHLKATGMNEQNALRQAINTDIENIRNYPTSDPMKIANSINTLVDQISQDNTLLVAHARTVQHPPQVNLSVDVNLSDAPTSEQPTADSSAWGTIKNTLSWTAGKASEIGSATWEQLESLVQVTPLNNEDNKIILSSSEEAVLRENIKLRLLSARITLLQGQYEQADKELSDISKTIETYFDTTKASNVLQQLNELSAELKNISFPHPTHTIAALETLQSDQ